VDVQASSPPKSKPQELHLKTLQASVSMLNVKVHDNTVRKRLNKYGLFGRVAGEELKLINWISLDYDYNELNSNWLELDYII